MSTAEQDRPGSPPATFPGRWPRPGKPPTAGEHAAASGLNRVLLCVALAAVLALALGLRLWGIGTGLPYVYNVDEAAHFVPKAVGMSSGGLDPRYFVNPPALTYLLHAVFSLWFGGPGGVLSAFAHHPAAVFLLSRVIVALLGTLSVWLLYLLGVHLLEDRRAALLAAALEAVAFLPVFYGHFALNDAAALAPLTLSLLGSALVLRCGRARDYALAGAGLGLACATKYTAGIALLPLLAAAWARHRDERALACHGRGGSGAVPVALAAACALGAFLLANPYALLDFHRFRTGLAHQSTLAAEAQGKLGAPQDGGIAYYLWSLTWGLGWAPALAALGGALAIWRRDARLGWLLVPAPVLFLALMGSEGRYFGRWLLPVFPLFCLLAAFFALRLAEAAAPRRAAAPGGSKQTGRPAEMRARGDALRRALAVLASAVLLAQGVVYSVHSDLVLSRADTRSLARSWLVAHVPRGARIVLEPIVRNEGLQEGGRGQPSVPGQQGGPGQQGTHALRWQKYFELGPLVSAGGESRRDARRATQIEEYELTLTPALIARYELGGWCWVVSGSTQSGRAFADPGRAPWAVAYYRALTRQGQVAYRVSPYGHGSAAVPFSFDWSFDYYPLSYVRPGPEVTVYRLHGGHCT